MLVSLINKIEGRAQVEWDGLLALIMDQLVELQRQLAGLSKIPANAGRQPTPEEIIKAAEAFCNYAIFHCKTLCI